MAGNNEKAVEDYYYHQELTCMADVFLFGHGARGVQKNNLSLLFEIIKMIASNTPIQFVFLICIMREPIKKWPAGDDDFQYEKL